MEVSISEIPSDRMHGDIASALKSEDVPILQCSCEQLQAPPQYAQYTIETCAVGDREQPSGATTNVQSRDKESEDLTQLDSHLQAHTSPQNVSVQGDVQTACCRICHDDSTQERLISPCYCTGSVGFVHFSCLEKWLQTNCRSHCELCLAPFPVEKVMPSIWAFLRHPRQNLDMPSFVCDVSCFCLLTPLLLASTYLCSIGFTHYQKAGKPESLFAVATLIISLITVYIAWATLSILYHRRVWLTWQEKNCQIRMFPEGIQPRLPTKSVERTSRDGDTLVNDSCRIAPQLDSTSLLLRPIVLLSRGRLLQVHSSIGGLGFCETSRR